MGCRLPAARGSMAAMGERSETDTLVVGAGPAGLAAGACLRRAGVPFEIVERGDAVGVAWRGHYDRLHLHTAKNHSALPFTPFPRDLPCYVPRAKVVEYLESYAREHALAPTTGFDVASVRREDGAGSGFAVEARDGRRVRARRVVVCTGYNRAPVRPSWPGQEAFAGEVLHSSKYKNGKAFQGKRVLVVGIGNTGGEIAIDLHEHGARPALSVRSPVVVIPRDFLGAPTQVTGILMNPLPLSVREVIGKAVSRLAFGDLSPLGFGRPTEGPARMIERGRIPLIDVGTIALVREGKITVVPGIERFETGGAVFTDGRRLDLDAVVLATGYTTGLADFLEGAAAVTDAKGYPRSHFAGDVSPAHEGIYFLGFVNPPTGFLRQIAIDAPRIVARIAKARGAAR